jgi:hypothetical protein
MNDKQRQFLVQQVAKIYDNQKNSIKAKYTKRPSLNNYIVAALIEGKLKYKDIKDVQKDVKARVIKMSTEDRLIHESSSSRSGYGYYGRSGDDDKGELNLDDCYVKINPFDMFEIPQSYKDAYNIWLDSKRLIDKELQDLSASYDTILLKVNLGSNAVLDKLIEQVDNLAELSLVNAHLTISPVTQPQISEGEKNQQLKRS